MAHDSDEIEQLDANQRTAERGEGRPPFKQRLVAEVKGHPFGYTVLAIFVVAGPIAAPLLFPQAPPAAAIIGGLAFGVYAALSAVPQKFM